MDTFDREQHGALIDPQRTAFLYDAGSTEYAATVTVDCDGNEFFWLVATEQLEYDNPDLGNANQRHEKLGRLPQAIRDRIWGDALRCGRPTRAGRPCRIRVANPGDPCGTHAKPRCADCRQLMFKQGGVWGCFGCHPDRYWTPAEAPP